MLRVGHGRDLETRKRACDAIFATATAELAPVFDRIPLGISLEMQEIERWLMNPRIRELLARQSKELLEEFLRQATA